MTTPSLYERVLGERFVLLAPAVQRFHRLAGRVVLHGLVRTDPPASWLAKLVAMVLGTPRHAIEGALRFELEADPGSERWTRYFPRHTMSSQLRWKDGRIEEHLGAVRLTFDLHPADSVLRMHLVRMRCLGISCPRRLMPRITAEETGHGDQLHFRVIAALPWVGTVASYRGHLVLGSERAP